MRLKVNFGLVDNREIHWYKPLEDFPKLLKYLGKNYEWFLYDKDQTGYYDMVLTFSELPSYDPNYNVYCTDWHDLFEKNGNYNSCECGARFTSFPFDHMRYCRLWTKW